MTYTPTSYTLHIYTVGKIFIVAQTTFPYAHMHRHLNTTAESFALISTYSAHTYTLSGSSVGQVVIV